MMSKISSLLQQSQNRISRLFLLIGLLIVGQYGQANTVSTGTIAASSLSQDCVEYKVVGVCFWLKCGWGGCRIKTSVKVKHYIPELVVSSYVTTGKNPWSAVSSFGSANSTAQSGGNATEGDKKAHNNLRFKNVDAIGHPSVLGFNLVGSSGYTCDIKDNAVIPFFPYYLSTLDTPAWRYGVPEMFYPEALIPGRRELKKNGDMWGNIFPRSGFVTQSHDYKAGAVAAQRSVDFITRSNQPHVYKKIVQSSSPSRGYWPPQPITEGTKTHKWQMLLPEKNKSCRLWPDKSVAAGINDPYGSRVNDKGDYVWAFWRPYMCCKPRGKFLYSVGS